MKDQRWRTPKQRYFISWSKWGGGGSSWLKVHPHTITSWLLMCWIEDGSRKWLKVSPIKSQSEDNPLWTFVLFVASYTYIRKVGYVLLTGNCKESPALCNAHSGPGHHTTISTTAIKSARHTLHGKPVNFRLAIVIVLSSSIASLANPF